MIVSGYTLDLYCDEENNEHEYNEFPHTYFSELGSTCRKKAKADGWRLTRDNKCYCPKCNKKNMRLKENGE